MTTSSRAWPSSGGSEPVTGVVAGAPRPRDATREPPGLSDEPDIRRDALVGLALPS